MRLPCVLAIGMPRHGKPLCRRLNRGSKVRPARKRTRTPGSRSGLVISTLWLENEALLDAVTALSGSGPAYVFYFIEAMQQAGVGLGLTPQQATELSIATFRGAAQLATQATEPLAVLRERVTSKGGTTHAALCSLQDNNVAQSIMQAVNAAAARSQSLGDEFGHE